MRVSFLFEYVDCVFVCWRVVLCAKRVRASVRAVYARVYSESGKSRNSAGANLELCVFFYGMSCGSCGVQFEWFRWVAAGLYRMVSLVCVCVIFMRVHVFVCLQAHALCVCGVGQIDTIAARWNGRDEHISG